ncbi:MAG: restriction endonuclease subunit S [gamma proteobacterium symbiont of Clathrolucina costata]
MNHYRAYPAYKDSGVEWLGHIPNDWICSPVKHYFYAVLGKMVQPEQKSEDDAFVPYHKAATVQWECVDDAPESHMWASKRDLASYDVQKGDLLICEGGDVGRAAIVTTDVSVPTIFQNSLHRVRSRTHELPVKWLLRVMEHVHGSDWLSVICGKSTFVHFTNEKLNDLVVPIPPSQEVGEITTALDREISRIDALIEKKNRFIDLLKEKRGALITHAVTKGLGHNVKTKDSGVQWIGQVPEHWEVVPSTWLFIESKERAHEGDQHLSATQKYGVIPLAEYERLEGRQVTHAVKNLEQRKHVELDDFVISMRSFQGGIERVKARGCVRSSYVVIQAEAGADKNYFAYLFKSGSYIQGLQATSSFIRDGQDLNYGNFRQVKLPRPDLDEQKRIAEFLDQETARIEALAKKTEHSVSLLKERRAAFITAAVTGQIDLRGKQ